MDAGLVDTLTLRVIPVVLIAGIALFTGIASRVDLTLTSSKEIGGGVVQLHAVRRHEAVTAFHAQDGKARPVPSRSFGYIHSSHLLARVTRHCRAASSTLPPAQTRDRFSWRLLAMECGENVMYAVRGPPMIRQPLCMQWSLRRMVIVLQKPLFILHPTRQTRQTRGKHARLLPASRSHTRCV